MEKENIYNHNENLDEELIEEAINQNDSEILNSVGANYYNCGEYNKAKKYYELASTMGNDTAMSNLGYVYMYGRGVPVDYTMAFSYFRLSAKRGNIEANYKLGNLYQSGKGVKKNINLAIEYYDKALNLIEKNNIKKSDYPSVYFTLAKEMMPNGNKKQDLEKAYKFLKIAVNGYEHLIEDEAASHYRKVYEDAKKLLESEIFKEYKND